MAPRDAVDPRVTRTRAVVLGAVLEELAEVGHARFTIESVAARCGVGKSTIYRHWPGKPDLIVDAMRELNVQPAPDLDGAPRERIRRLLHHLGDALTEGRVAAAMPALIEAAEREPEIRRLLDEYTTERRRALVDAIADAVTAGQVHGSVHPDLAARALSGAVFYARLLTSTPMTAASIDRLVTTVLGTPPELA